MTEALLATQSALQGARNVAVSEWDRLLRVQSVLGHKAELVADLGAKVEAILLTGPSLEPPSGWEEGNNSAAREWQDHLHRYVWPFHTARFIQYLHAAQRYTNTTIHF